MELDIESSRLAMVRAILLMHIRAYGNRALLMTEDAQQYYSIERPRFAATCRNDPRNAQPIADVLEKWALLSLYPDRTYLSQLPVWSHRNPTHDNIIDALRVPGGANASNFVYIHFSSNGTRGTTVFSGLKNHRLDDEDRALVPNDITVAENSGPVVTVVLGCHSGGTVRDEDSPGPGETRSIPKIYKSGPNSTRQGL
ncbi:hypothetical protein GGR58DRAFT_509399 [Xylaria digitata]|nr:hypothetical protein GGR58DRAFT_509399 [Xylaria digitata]